MYLTADKLGNYTFSCSVAENDRYTAASGTFTMTVNKGTTVITPNLWNRQTDSHGKLTNTQIGYFIIKELDERTPTITMTSYPSGANASFTYQRVSSSSNSYAVYLTTDKEGDYTFSCSVTDNGRWTAATSTKTIKVTSLTPDTYWYEDETLSNVYEEWGYQHEVSAGVGYAVETDRNYAEGYNTFCTAFNIPRDEFEYIFGSDVKVYTFQWATKDRIMHFRPYSGDLNADEPYLLYLNHAVPAPIYNTYEWMSAEYWDSGNASAIGNAVSHDDEEGNTYYYIGTAACNSLDDMLPSGKTYKNVRFITAGGHELLTPTATGNLKGWRCVFVYPDKEATAGASAREFVSFDDDETTGISSIYSLDELNIDADDNTPEYNTAGQRVGKGYRGILIRNGRKYLKR